MEELNHGTSWKWAGRFLWLLIHYDHEFKGRGPRECEVVFRLDGEGFGVSVFGRLLAWIYKRNLEEAIPNLVREMESEQDKPKEEGSPTP
jgi:hypothetical protein